MALLTLVAAIFCIHCNGRTGVPSADIPSAQSLLLITPYIGDEVTPREPAPETQRLTLTDESIEGWIAPQEKILRFPVEVDSGARLSFMFCVRTDEAIENPDIFFKAEFVRDGQTSGDVIFPENRNRTRYTVNRWIRADVPIGVRGTTKGEIRLIIEGSLSDDPEIIKFWGQPTVYHPDRMRQRNVLLIGVDTLRRDSCSPFTGDPSIMPNLVALTGECTLFARNWSQAPWTLPSFSSIITGRFPSSIGATGYNEHLPDSARTIAEILREQGYATETVCGNPWLGNDNSGFHQGMDGLWYHRNSRAHVSIAKVEEFITRSENRDWFCFLHFQDPHTSYEPLAQYADRLCDPSYNGEYKYSFTDENEWRADGFTPNDADLEQVRNLHEAEVAYVDSSLRRLFCWMEEKGVLDDTLIIFAADHGEEFFDHGRFGHGQSQYEELVRTPLIVRGPGFPAGARIDTPAGNLDIVPTILSYLDLPVPDELPGMPLQDLASGGMDENRIIFGEECDADAVKFCVEWPYKCILNFTTGETELYNLEIEPDEIENIGAQNPDLVERLSREIVLNMIPRDHLFLLAIIGNPDDDPLRFTGTLEIPGGIRFVREYAFEEGDTFTVDGTTINFDVVSARSDARVEKILVIFPAHGSYLMDANVTLDGSAPGDRFYPFGSDTPEPSGVAHLDIAEFPWPADIQSGYITGKSACYIVGVPGLDPEDSGEYEGRVLDEESIEQLRALGYLGG